MKTSSRPSYRPLLFALSILALPLLALRCGRKDDPKPAIAQLPPATTTGADKWGCLVNGEVWTSNSMRGDWTTANGMSVSMGFTSYVGNQPQAHNINLFIPDSTRSYSIRVGRFPIITSGFRGSYARIQTPAKIYYETAAVRGSIIITRLDKQARIVSGTFDFIVADGPNDTIRVTDGRFDGHLDL